jgi:hypothetical protein
MMLYGISIAKTILVTLIILGTILISGCFESEDSEWVEIKENIVAVHVDYSSGIPVRNIANIEIVFNEFIAWAKDNDIDIFGSAYGNNWRFNEATIHGLYEDTKYWKVNASWYSEDKGIWRIKSVFDVNENGEVVRLLRGV